MIEREILSYPLLIWKRLNMQIAFIVLYVLRSQFTKYFKYTSEFWKVVFVDNTEKTFTKLHRNCKCHWSVTCVDLFPSLKVRKAVENRVVLQKVFCWACAPKSQKTPALLGKSSRNSTFLWLYDMHTHPKWALSKLIFKAGIMPHIAQNVFSSLMNSIINALSKESWVKHEKGILFRHFPPIVFVAKNNGTVVGDYISNL